MKAKYFKIEIQMKMPKFSENSYLQFTGLGRSVLLFTELDIIIKPENETGLILYNGFLNKGEGDYILVALRDGYVVFSFDLGAGPVVLRHFKFFPESSFYYMF